MSKENQKLKLLYLLDILKEKTDEEHLMTANELCQELAKYDVPAERKVIYRDIALLRDTYHLDIMEGDRKNPGYALIDREFETAELKLLVDAVQASRFITARKSEELIRKLEKLTSRYQAMHLQRQVYIYNRTKAENETIYYNVDMIHTAISENVQIRFQYAEWTREKKIRLRKDGAFYQISPWSLTWNEEGYYLIAFDDSAGQIRHYRVDKMRSMSLTEEERLGQEEFRAFDLAAFTKKTFGMFGGPTVRVTLLCSNHMAGVMIDRFGTDVIMMPVGENQFKTRFEAAVSSQFFGWLAGLGDAVEILEPLNVREEYREYLHRIVRIYKND